MLQLFTVSLFGHRELDNPVEIERKLDMVIRKLIREKDYVEFLLGKSGAFDLIAASVIHRAQRELGYKNSSLILVLPYETADYRDNAEYLKEYYDDIYMYEESSKVHFKAAIQVRNRAMVDKSQLVICCVQHTAGGAYQTIRYAQSKGKEIINLAEYDKT